MIAPRTAGSASSLSSTRGKVPSAWRKSADVSVCSATLATGGLTAGEVGGDCGCAGCTVNDGVSAAAAAFSSTTDGNFSAAEAGGFSATEGADLSGAEGADFSAAAGAGLDGGGLRKESMNAHPPASQTASMKTTPALRTAFCSVLRCGAERVFPRPSLRLL